MESARYHYKKIDMTKIKYVPENMKLTPKLKEELDEIQKKSTGQRLTGEYIRGTLTHIIKRLQRKGRVSLIPLEGYEETRIKDRIRGVRRTLPPQIQMDTKKVYNKLIQGGFINKKLKPIPKIQILSAQDVDIISYYSSVAHGLMSYYRCADNIQRLVSVVRYFLKYSLIYTLMNKHKLCSAKTVIKKYGQTLKVQKGDHIVEYIPDYKITALEKEFLITPVLDP